MQVQTAVPPGVAVFLHVPVTLFTVHVPPALHSVPPGGVLHVPAWSSPARCRNPGKPLNVEQTP
jgi:hypothetical protein